LPYQCTQSAYSRQGQAQAAYRNAIFIGAHYALPETSLWKPDHAHLGMHRFQGNEESEHEIQVSPTTGSWSISRVATGLSGFSRDLGWWHTPRNKIFAETPAGSRSAIGSGRRAPDGNLPSSHARRHRQFLAWCDSVPVLKSTTAAKRQRSRGMSAMLRGSCWKRRWNSIRAPQAISFTPSEIFPA
jgi:hypothetical protein